MELQLVAQSILAEMTKNLNQSIEYYDTLGTHMINEYIGRDQLVAETTIATWQVAMSLVARQAGIRIDWAGGIRKREPRPKPVLKPIDPIYQH